MARTYLDSNGVTSLVQKIRQNFYTEGDAIEASAVTASGTVDANLLMGKIANSSTDTSGSTVGSATQPVYLKSGVITATGSSLDVDISGNAATATTSTTLGTSTVGASTKPIYLSSGTPTASNSTVGSATKPIYLSSGTLTESKSTVGSATKPIYLSSGTLTASDSTVGSSTRPVYLSSGVITQAGTSLAVDITGNAATATKLGTSTVGSGAIPIYLLSGVPTVCDALSPSIISAGFGDSAGIHNAFFRGNSLGSSLTDEQSAAIRAGTFDDLYIGDYWTINSVNWRIAHFDYFYNCGDTNCTTHHVVVVPDSSLYSAQMHNTDSGEYESGSTANTTEGGYVGSDMYTTNLEQAKEIAIAAFGENHILTHREYLTNAVTNGYPSAGAWYDCTLELMNEIMVYGCHVYAPMGNGSTVPNKYTVNKSQLALYRLRNGFVNINRGYGTWLRDVVSSAVFAYAGSLGRASYHDASYVFGVRPAVPIY